MGKKFRPLPVQWKSDLPLLSVFFESCCEFQPLRVSSGSVHVLPALDSTAGAPCCEAADVPVAENDVPPPDPPAVETADPSAVDEASWTAPQQEMIMEYEREYDADDYDFDDPCFDYEQLFFDRLYNKKRSGATERSKKSTKIENGPRWINARRQTKKEADMALMDDVFQRQKANSKTSVSCRVSGLGAGSGGLSQEEADIKRAIAASLAPGGCTRRKPCGSAATASAAHIVIVVDPNFGRLAPITHVTPAANLPLSAAQLNDLMNRELTPEDYELLLMLDEGVKKKTLSSSIIASFDSLKFEGGDGGAERCSVCMVDYEVGECLKALPCGHRFHPDCIQTWLTKSSVNCPIDGLPVSAC